MEDAKAVSDVLFSVRNLRYLHAISLYGGVRAAAETLSINASVISRKIASLERAYGVALLEKYGRGIKLTEIGETLVQYFLESSRRDAEILAYLEDYRGMRRGRLKIGISEGRVEELLAVALGPFSQQFPDIIVDLRAGATAEIITMIRNDEVDLGLCVGGISDPTLQTRTFRAAPICAIVSPNHALATESRLQVEQLIGQRLIFMPASFGVQQVVELLARTEKITLTPAYRCDLFLAAQAIAASGLGVAFMSTIAARQYLDSGKLVAIPIDHPITRNFTTQLIRRIGNRASPAAKFLWNRLILALQDERNSSLN